MSKELKISKNNVDLTIHFEKVDELKQKLEDYDKIWEVVKEKIGTEVIDKRVISSDLNGICQIQDNKVILKKIPKSPLHKVILTVYAYGPIGCTTNEISVSTGIEQVSSKIITPTKNKKYFRKLEDNKWYLSSDGLEMVEKIRKKLT